jgi:malonyl-CoA O-methyltransferase
MDIKQGIRRNFARRAGSYDRHADTQRFMGQELLSHTREWVSRVSCILEIGCGTGYLTQQLRGLNAHARLVALDLDLALLSVARRRLGPDPRVTWLVADGEAFGRGCFDLIISNATFQWLTLPTETLAAYFHCLKPGGVLAFATLGPRTFQELGAALQEAARALNLSGAPEIAAQSFLSPESWQGLLAGAGFPQVRMAHELKVVDYPSVGQFLSSLQATGATNPQPRPFSPRLLKAMIDAYGATFANNGTVPVTYEIIWAVAHR